MSLLKTILGVGLVAGAAYGLSKLIQKYEANPEEEWTAQPGEYAEDADGYDGKEAMLNAPAVTQKTVDVVYPASPDIPPNVNPVDRAAPAHVQETDPLKIADAADFGDWDDLGCQG